MNRQRLAGDKEDRDWTSWHFIWALFHRSVWLEWMLLLGCCLSFPYVFWLSTIQFQKETIDHLIQNPLKMTYQKEACSSEWIYHYQQPLPKESRLLQRPSCLLLSIDVAPVIRAFYAMPDMFRTYLHTNVSTQLFLPLDSSSSSYQSFGRQRDFASPFFYLPSIQKVCSCSSQRSNERLDSASPVDGGLNALAK